MKVSTRGDYAARALLSLALHGTDTPTSVKDIADGKVPDSSFAQVWPFRALTLDIPLLRLTVVCCHRPFGGGTFEREDAARQWLVALDQHLLALARAGKRVLFAGDLNTSPVFEHSLWKVTSSLGLRDCTHGTTELTQHSHFPYRVQG